MQYLEKEKALLRFLNEPSEKYDMRHRSESRTTSLFGQDGKSYPKLKVKILKLYGGFLYKSLCNRFGLCLD